MKIEFTQKEVEELYQYVDLEGTEIGDYLSQLLLLWDVPESHGKNISLQNAIDTELWHWLKRFRREATITETTVCREPIIRKELEWL